jgi:hypothetical protein
MRRPARLTVRIRVLDPIPDKRHNRHNRAMDTGTLNSIEQLETRMARLAQQLAGLHEENRQLRARVFTAEATAEHALEIATIAIENAPQLSGRLREQIHQEVRRG